MSDIQQWNQYAELYHQGKGISGDDLHNDLIKPTLDKFLGDYSGKRVLDAGCGNGFLENYLAEKAKQVVGIDSSEKLLSFAKKNISQENVEFKQENLLEKLPVADSSFDIVIANMVLQYLPELSIFAQETERTLKPNGTFLMFIDHPSHALFLRAQELMGKKNEKFINSGGYFESGLRKKHSLWNQAILQYYHRPLSNYLNVFSKHLRLDQVEEVSNDGEIPRILGAKWTFLT